MLRRDEEGSSKKPLTPEEFLVWLEGYLDCMDFGHADDYSKIREKIKEVQDNSSQPVVNVPGQWWIGPYGIEEIPRTNWNPPAVPCESSASKGEQLQIEYDRGRCRSGG